MDLNVKNVETQIHEKENHHIHNDVQNAKPKNRQQTAPFFTIVNFQLAKHFT